MRDADGEEPMINGEDEEEVTWDGDDDGDAGDWGLGKHAKLVIRVRQGTGRPALAAERRRPSGPTFSATISGHAAWAWQLPYPLIPSAAFHAVSSWQVHQCGVCARSRNRFRRRRVHDHEASGRQRPRDGTLP
jgi:hypothetical protein